MAFTVTVRQAAKPLKVEIGQTILEAALVQGVPYPYGCRSGNCGACKSRLYSGEVEMAPYSDFALSVPERAGGLILACRSVPWSDAEVAWLSQGEVIAHPHRVLSCRVAAIDRMTHDIVRLRLDIVAGGPFVYSAGQYASVTLDALAPRDYSMASPPGTGMLEFHIRAVAGGKTSAYAGHRLRPGEAVRVEGPYGGSWLRESHRGPIVAIAGGSGLAPIKAIVERALEAGMGQPIHLYFGARAERDVYLEDHFATLAALHDNFHFAVVLSAPNGPTSRRTGLVHEAVAAELADLDGAKLYLAGPPPMVEAAARAARGLGARDEDIHADAFYTEAEKAALETTP